MSKKIFVGNLPYAATNDEIHGSFTQYGEVVSTRIITDRETGRSKGFAFVEMANDEEAQAAIDSLNGAEYLGRTIVVNEARPREGGMSAPRTGDRPRYGNNTGGRGGNGGPSRRPYGSREQDSSL
jgi:RNA recognition motif-containing protein